MIVEIYNAHLVNGVQIAELMANLSRPHKVLLLFGGLSLPFDCKTGILVGEVFILGHQQNLQNAHK